MTLCRQKLKILTSLWRTSFDRSLWQKSYFFLLMVYFIFLLFRSSSILAYFPKGTHYDRSRILVIYFRFLLFCSRLSWHISQREHITIRVIGFISSSTLTYFPKKKGMHYSRTPNRSHSIQFLGNYFRNSLDFLSYSLLRWRQEQCYDRLQQSTKSFKFCSVFLIFSTSDFQSLLIGCRAYGRGNHLEKVEIMTTGRNAMADDEKSKNLIRRSKNLRGDSVGPAGAMADMIAS